jgi:hypothetical protein
MYNYYLKDSDKIVFCSPLVRAMETAFFSYPGRTFSYKLYKLKFKQNDLEDLSPDKIYVIPFIKEKGITPDNDLPDTSETNTKFSIYLQKLKDNALLDKNYNIPQNNVLFTDTENIKTITRTQKIFNTFNKILSSLLKLLRNQYIKDTKKFIFVSHNNFIQSFIGKSNVKTSNNKLTNTMIINIHGNIIYEPPNNNFFNIPDNDKLCLFTVKDNGDLITNIPIENNEHNNSNAILNMNNFSQLINKAKYVKHTFTVTSFNTNKLPLTQIYKFITTVINENPDKLFYVFGIQESDLSNDKYIKLLDTITKDSNNLLNYYYCNKEAKLNKSNTKLFILYKDDNNITFNNTKFYNVTSKKFKNLFNKHIITVDVNIGNLEPISFVLTHLPKKKLEHFFNKDLPKFKDNLHANTILFGDLNARTLIFNQQQQEYKLYNDIKFNKGHNNALKGKIEPLKTKTLRQVLSSQEKPYYKNSLDKILKDEKINTFEFKETGINFNIPTYRYDKTAPYELSIVKMKKGETKFKVPSFPDRVLYRGDNINPYDSKVITEGYGKGSDHLPILVNFNYLSNESSIHESSLPTSTSYPSASSSTISSTHNSVPSSALSSTGQVSPTQYSSSSSASSSTGQVSSTQEQSVSSTQELPIASESTVPVSTTTAPVAPTASESTGPVSTTTAPVAQTVQALLQAFASNEKPKIQILNNNEIKIGTKTYNIKDLVSK